MAELRRAVSVEGAACRDENLQLDEVDAGGHLGGRMLDLQPRVDLEESEEFPIWLVEVLDGGRTVVSGGPDEFGRHGPKMVRLRFGQHRRTGFFDHLLIPALDRAIAHSRRPDIAVIVGDDLDLDVPRIGDQSFEEHHRIAE